MHPKLPMSAHYQRVLYASDGPARHVESARRAKHDHLKAQQYERDLRPVIPKGGHAHRGAS